MSGTFVVSKNRAYCSLVILIIFLSGQDYQFFQGENSTYTYFLYYVKFLAVAFLTAYTLSSSCRKITTPEAKAFLRLFRPLLLLFLITEMVAAIFSPVPRTYGIRYWTRSVSLLLQWACNVCMMICCLALCGKDAPRCFCSAAIADEILLLGASIIHEGPMEIFRSFVDAFSLKEGSTNFFEVHELTFCIGLLLIYYLFFEKKTSNNIIRILALGFWFIVGSKRIAFAAIVCAAVFAFFLHTYGSNKKKLIVYGCIGVSVCFLYLYLIYSGAFMEILDMLGVNKMGRNLIYGYYTRRTELSPVQLGWGLSGVAKTIENLDRAEVYNMVDIRALHNDILKIYINFGFWGSLAWFVYSLVGIPQKLYKFFGKKTASVYMILAVYMYVTYLTDNTEGYFLCQSFFFTLPIAYYLAIRDPSLGKLV